MKAAGLPAELETRTAKSGSRYLCPGQLTVVRPRVLSLRPRGHAMLLALSFECEVRCLSNRTQR